MRITLSPTASMTLDYDTLCNRLTAIDPAMYPGTGFCLVSGSPDPANNGRAFRLSAFYETEDTIAAVHWYRLASGKLDGPYWSRNCTSIARGDIRADRCGRAILAAEPIVRQYVANARANMGEE